MVGSGYADGSATLARFDAPSGLSRDADGNLYVADRGNFVVRKISPNGSVSTLAGLAGAAGAVNGAGSAARFVGPYDVALDPSGNVYVADVPATSGVEPAVRKISPSGAVSTLPLTFLAGQAAVDFGIALDAAGNLYVGFRNNIYKVTPAGVETTLASAATFANPLAISMPQQLTPQFSGLAVAADGSVYAADLMGHVIRRVAPNGSLSVLAGRPGCSNQFFVTANPVCGTMNPSISPDGVGDAARFANPRWVALDAGGNLMVVNRPGRPTAEFSDMVRKITPAGVVTTAYGFNGLAGLSLDAQGVAYHADSANARILRKPLDQPFTVLSGVGALEPSPSTAFWRIAADASGQIFGLRSDRLFKVSGQGSVNDWASIAGRQPTGLASDSAGTAYLIRSTDTNMGFASRLVGGELLKVSAAGVVSSVWATNSFVPFSVAAAANGTVFVAGGFDPTLSLQASTTTPYVVVLAPSGQVTGQLPLRLDSQVETVGNFFKFPEIAADAGGNLIVAGYNTISKVSPAGAYSLIAGSPSASGSVDGVGNQARFGDIRGLALDAAGNIYIADATHVTVRKITPAGVVTTAIGKFELQSILGNAPVGSLAFDAAGFLYVNTQQAVLRARLP